MKTEYVPCISQQGFPGVSVVKNPPANAEDAGSIPGSGRPPGYSPGVCKELDMTERLSMHAMYSTETIFNIL